MHLIKLSTLCFVLLGVSAQAGHHEADAKADKLIQKVIAAVGSYADLQAKGDVQYNYVYRDNTTFTSDISTERYLFDGELSWAEYHVHDKFVFPGQDGPVVQGWDGENAWTTLAGQPVTDPEAVGLAAFLRKTNFYWFAMMQKLDDPGTIHKYKGTRDVHGTAYELIELSFDVPEGTEADTYLLYIHPETHRVDRFLFTVVDFGLTDPVLMEVDHQRFGDIVLPVTRRYTPALSWEGDVADDAVWIDEQMTDIEFGNGFTPGDFKAPG
ncbi:MAG: hypothetical protein AAGH99_09175 [Planctomycetota bacterium]